MIKFIYIKNTGCFDKKKFNTVHSKYVWSISIAESSCNQTEDLNFKMFPEKHLCGMIYL